MKKSLQAPVSRTTETPPTGETLGRTKKTVTFSNLNLAAMGEVTIQIEGISPLIMNQFSHKMRDEILKKQMGGGKTKPPAKNPEQCMLDALHVIGKKPKTIEDLDKTRFGFPAVAFKSAMVRMAKMSGVPMTDARLMFWVNTDDGELVEIFSDVPEMRVDTARIQNTCDIRIRPEFKNWKAKLRIGYAGLQINAEQIVAWVADAGMLNGIGEMRPGGRQSSGVCGMWKIVGNPEALVPDIEKLKAAR